jgi:translocation and assembly module TamB
VTTAPAVTPAPRAHRRLRRALVWIGAVLATLLMVLAAASTWMVNSRRGAKFAFERLEHALPGKLEVDTLIGSIWGPLEVRKLSYKSERVQITMDRMRIAWSLRALVTRRLDVHELLADNVRVEVAAAGEKLADQDTLKPLADFRLPLDIMIHKGLFQRVRIVSTAADSGTRADTSIALDRLTMRDMAFRDTLTIGSLAAHSPLGDVEVHGGGRTHAGYRADFQLTWNLHPPQFAPITGRGKLIGSLDTLRVIQTIQGPLDADVDAVVFAPTRDMRVNGRMVVRDLDAHQFDPRLPEGHASGALDFQGRPLDFVTTGTFDARTVAYGRARVDWNARRKKDVVQLVSFGVTPHGRSGHLAARGSLETTAPGRLDLVADWRNLGWPLVGDPSFVTLRGHARIGGSLARWTLASDAMVGVPALRDTARMQVKGVGDTTGLNVALATVGVFGGTVSGRGRVDWSPVTTWRLAVTGRDLDPATRWPGFPGALAFTGSSQGRWLESGPNGEIALASVTGTVREQALAGHARFGLAGPTTHVRELDVSLGPNRLTASGDLGPASSLRWTVHAPDLATVLPRGAGTLDAEGSVTGPRETPHLTASVKGDSIHWGRYGVEGLTAKLDLGSGDQGPLKLEADGVNVRIAPRLFRHVGLRGDGTRGRHTLALTAASRDDSLSVAAAGGLTGMREWRGELRTLDVTTPNLGTWTLEKPARLAAGADHADLHEFCWRSGDARMCADATWVDAGPWTLRSTLAQVPLRLLQVLTPPDVELDAPVAGTLDFHGRGASIFGDARITLGPGEIRYPTGDKKKATERLEASTVTVHGDGSSLDSRIALALVPAGSIDASVRMPGFRPANFQDGTQSIAGQLTLRLQSLRVAQAFLPDLTNTEGKLDANVRLLGTTSHPRWTGDVRLAGGAARVPRFALQLSDAELTANGDDAGHVSFDGGVRSGEGRLGVKGTATVAQTGLAAVDASIAGRNLTASNTRELILIVSPDLHVFVHADSLMVKGEVEVPRADVREPKTKRHPAVPSRDVRFVGRVEEEKKGEPLKLHGEVRMVLGRDVRVRARGLDGKPTGSVLAIKTPGQPLLATGQLQLTEGKYKAYGQNLTIETGRLVFGGGPIVNPGLDVRATRKAKDGVTAGFEVHGTLETPQLSVFSDPPMAERDALAYALLGHSLDPSNQNENSIMNDAANSLSLRGGDYVAGTLARRLGLDEASIESESGTFENSSLRLGAYLSPRVYVNYGVGILEQVSTLRIQYFLSRMWTLQAEAGPENSAQVLYSFERGRTKRQPHRTQAAPVRPDSVVTVRSQVPAAP